MPRLVSSTAAGLSALLLIALGSNQSGPLRPVTGHAVMIEPRSRPWMEYLKNYNYLPHQVRKHLCVLCWIDCIRCGGRSSSTDRGTYAFGWSPIETLH